MPTGRGEVKKNSRRRELRELTQKSLKVCKWSSESDLGRY